MSTATATSEQGTALLENIKRLFETQFLENSFPKAFSFLESTVEPFFNNPSSASVPATSLPGAIKLCALLVEKLEHLIEAKETRTSKFLTLKFTNDVACVVSRLKILFGVEQEPTLEQLPPETSQLWKSCADKLAAAMHFPPTSSPAANSTKLSKIPFSIFFEVLEDTIHKSTAVIEKHLNPFVFQTRKFEFKLYHMMLLRFFLSSSLFDVDTAANSSSHEQGPIQDSLYMIELKQFLSSITILSQTNNYAEESTPEPGAEAKAPFAQHDFLHNFTQVIILDEEKELHQTKIAVLNACIDLTTWSLDQTLQQKLALANQFNAFFDYKFQTSNGESKDEKHAAWKLEKHRRWYEYRLRDTAKELLQLKSTRPYNTGHQTLTPQMGILQFDIQEPVQPKSSEKPLIPKPTNSELLALPSFSLLDKKVSQSITDQKEVIQEDFFTLYSKVAFHEIPAKEASISFDSGILVVTDKKVYFYSSQNSATKLAFKYDHILQIALPTPETPLTKSNNQGFNPLFANQLFNYIEIQKRDGQRFFFYNILNIDIAYKKMMEYFEASLKKILEVGETENIKEGWLKKKGGAVKNWKKRWFILSSERIVYKKDSTAIPNYNVPDESGTTKQKPTQAENNLLMLMRDSSLIGSPGGSATIQGFGDLEAKILGQILIKDIVGVEKENNMTKTKYPNSFSIITVERRYRIQATSMKEVDEWILAIQTTMKRKNLEFPYLYFGIYKKNIRSKFQWRILLFDFMTKTLKNLSVGNCQRQFNFMQIDKFTREKTENLNPMHFTLYFKHYPHPYEIYAQSLAQAVVLEFLLQKIIELNTKGSSHTYTISDLFQSFTDHQATATQRSTLDYQVRATCFAFEHMSKATASHGSPKQTLFSKIASSLKKSKPANSTPGGQDLHLAKRWLVIQIGQLIVFDGNCDGFPLYVIPLHHIKLSTQGENNDKTFTISFGTNALKTFEFASSEECNEWKALLDSERNTQTQPLLDSPIPSKLSIEADYTDDVVKSTAQLSPKLSIIRRKVSTMTEERGRGSEFIITSGHSKKETEEEKEEEEPKPQITVLTLTPPEEEEEEEIIKNGDDEDDEDEADDEEEEEDEDDLGEGLSVSFFKKVDPGSNPAPAATATTATSSIEAKLKMLHSGGVRVAYFKKKQSKPTALFFSISKDCSKFFLSESGKVSSNRKMSITKTRTLDSQVEAASDFTISVIDILELCEGFTTSVMKSNSDFVRNPKQVFSIVTRDRSYDFVCENEINCQICLECLRHALMLNKGVAVPNSTSPNNSFVL